MVKLIHIYIYILIYTNNNRNTINVIICIYIRESCEARINKSSIEHKYQILIEELLTNFN